MKCSIILYTLVQPIAENLRQKSADSIFGAVVATESPKDQTAKEIHISKNILFIEDRIFALKMLTPQKRYIIDVKKNNKENNELK